MRIDEFLQCLREALRWEDATFSHEVAVSYGRRLAEGVDGAIAAMAEHDPSAAETAGLLLQVLPDAEYLDFIAAPHIASMIVYPSMLSRGDHRKFFLRTLGIRAGCISDDAPLYNHRGENIAPGTGNRSAPARGNRFATSLGGELFIPFMDRGGNRLRPVSSEDAPAVLRKLEDAERLIAKGNGCARAFAALHTEVLAFRCEDEYGEDFSSGSFQALPGFSLICNCHLSSVGEADLADAIVHEAIHGIVYKFEAFGERLLPREKSGCPPVRSPWTGARLSMESFAQACLVWFGLHHFWKNVSEGKGRNFDERATRGFMSADYAKRCRESARFLSPGVASQLEQLGNHL